MTGKTIVTADVDNLLSTNRWQAKGDFLETVFATVVHAMFVINKLIYIKDYNGNIRQRELIIYLLVSSYNICRTTSQR